MAGELVGAPGTPIATLKAVLHADGKVYDRISASWADFASGNWSRYLIDMTVETGTNVYGGDLPAAAAALATHVSYHDGTTLGPAVSSQLLKIGRFYAFPGTSGLTLRGVIRRNAEAWDRVAEEWETYASGSWSDYTITMNEFAGTGIYTAAVPVGAEAWTRVTYHIGTSIGDAVYIQPRYTIAPGPGPSYPVALETVPYTPLAAWFSHEEIDIYRGSGVPIQFVQSGAPVVIDPMCYEARLGTQDGANPLRFSIANGKLSDAGNGVLIANPTADDTESLSTTEATVIELWRTDTDDNKTPVGKARVNVHKSISP